MDFPNLDNYNRLFHERDQQLQLLLHRSSQEATQALQCSRESLELVQKLYQNLSQLKVVDTATKTNDDDEEVNNSTQEQQQPRGIHQIKDTVLKVSRQCQLARDEAREAMEVKKKLKLTVDHQVCELKKELEAIQQENQQMEAQLSNSKALPLLLQLMSSSASAASTFAAKN